jgi:DNA-binding transcriptional MerR regulator
MNGYQIKQVKRALDNPEALTEWEYDFVQSLADREDRELSEKQNSILNRIAGKL